MTDEEKNKICSECELRDVLMRLYEKAVKWDDNCPFSCAKVNKDIYRKAGDEEDEYENTY